MKKEEQKKKKIVKSVPVKNVKNQIHIIFQSSFIRSSLKEVIKNKMMEYIGCNYIQSEHE